jgi:hypothetical protein
MLCIVGCCRIRQGDAQSYWIDGVFTRELQATKKVPARLSPFLLNNYWVKLSMFLTQLSCWTIPLPLHGTRKECYNVQLAILGPSRPTLCLSWGSLGWKWAESHRLPKSNFGLWVPSRASSPFHYLCMGQEKNVTMCNRQFMVHLRTCCASLGAA